jgi:hypothetical protein
MPQGGNGDQDDPFSPAALRHWHKVAGNFRLGLPAHAKVIEIPVKTRQEPQAWPVVALRFSQPSQQNQRELLVLAGRAK